MILDQTVKLGDLLTAGSVAIAIITLITGLYRNQRLKQKEYADRVRRAAATTAIAIGRWIEIAASLYSRLQPLITDTDAIVTKNGEHTGTLATKAAGNANISGVLETVAEKTLTARDFFGVAWLKQEQIY